MTERDLQQLFAKYIKDNPPGESEIYEYKICKQKSMGFDRVAEHQVKALSEAEKVGLYHKLTDQPWMKDRPYPFTYKKPFDAFFVRAVKSYIVIWFYVPRQPKIFYKIRIQDFINLKETCGRKSITREMANQTGIPIKI